MTSDDGDFLRDHGGSTAAAALVKPRALAQARAHRARIAAQTAHDDTAESMTMTEVAAQLGVDTAAIARRVEAGAMWLVNGRLPRWQIGPEGAPLPGLHVLVAAIPEGTTPATARAIMTTPQEEFDGATPIAYLEAGGVPAQVAAILAESGQW